MPANNNKFTRRNCPIVADDLKGFREIFGENQVQVTAVREGKVSIGHSWKLQCATCDAPAAISLNNQQYCIPCGYHAAN